MNLTLCPIKINFCIYAEHAPGKQNTGFYSQLQLEALHNADLAQQLSFLECSTAQLTPQCALHSLR